MVRPIFAETNKEQAKLPSTTPTELATAIIGCIEAGAKILNLSVDLRQPTRKEQHELEEILNYAARRGVVVVAAAGNEGTITSSALTRHPWVIAVVAYDRYKKPMALSNMAHSIGNRGLGAPGEKVSSLGTTTSTHVLSGTSAATPFVTGTIALLWSLFPSATAREVKLAVTQSNSRRRTTVIPPLLDAWTAYQTMRANYA
jgi:subtilisin family serine protease